MRIFFLFFSLIFSTLGFANQPLNVLVTIAPQKYLVDRITGNTANVQLLVPQELNSHTYEPTIQQVIDANNASLWFCIGDSFEKKLVRTLASKMTIVETREKIDLIEQSGGCSACSHTPYDTHIWLSAKLLKQQAGLYAEQLIAHASDKKELFSANLRLLLQELDDLDQSITKALASKKGATILVSHPAFAYFCRDYNLKQLPIEMEGSEPSPRYIVELIRQAKENNVTQIFVQKQYPLKSVHAIKRELNATLVEINPYEENVIDCLKKISKAIADS